MTDQCCSNITIFVFSVNSIWISLYSYVRKFHFEIYYLLVMSKNFTTFFGFAVFKYLYTFLNIDFTSLSFLVSISLQNSFINFVKKIPFFGFAVFNLTSKFIYLLVSQFHYFISFLCINFTSEFIHLYEFRQKFPKHLFFYLSKRFFNFQSCFFFSNHLFFT